MRFSMDERALVLDGAIDRIYRRWERARVVAGRSYRTNAGRLVVDEIVPVTPNSISDREAIQLGRASSAVLLGELRGEPGWPIFRISFSPDATDDPREELAATIPDETGLADLDRRLARLDAASSHGAWTLDVLRAVETRPAVRAPELAASFGRETQPFKLDVRKLKNLGLTYSLAVGYRLSPRGEAYLRHRR